MKKNIYLLILLISTSSMAQDLWEKNFSVSGLGSVFNIEHVDLDNDGLEDIIVGSNANLSWIKNMGNGHFAHQPLISSSGGSDFFCDDVDLDGDTDVLVSNRLYLNDGQGNLSLLEIEFESNQTIRGVMDYDGDGDKDLITIGNFNDVIDLQLNDGQLNFEFSQTLATGYSNWGVNHFSIIDIDQDTDPDFLLSHNNGLVLFENVAGDFIELAISDDAVGAFNHGDLDGDGDLDITLQNKTTEEVQLYLNNENENWNFASVIHPYTGSIRNIDLIDIDADNDLDVLFVRSNQIASWFENINGDFSTIHNASPISLSGIAKMVDLDNDNALDILTCKPGASASNTTPKVAWFKNEDNHFEERRGITFHFNEDQETWPTFAAGDMDNDGDQDLVIHERGIRISENYGANTLGMPRLIIDGTTYDDIVLKDVNQNGLLDILGINGDSLIWHLNDGNYNFTNAISIGTKQYASSLAANAADLDNDGDLDVIGQSFETQTNDSEIFWFENIDGVNYTKHILYNNLFRAGKIQTGDLDNDGDIDIVTTNHNSVNLLIFENQGNGQFTSFSHVAPGIPLSFYIIDMDNDGLNDLVFSNVYAGGGQISYIKNLGAGNWASHTQIASLVHGSTQPTIIYPTDMNGDGLTDIIYAIEHIRLNQFDYQSEAGVILNEGNGNFSEPNYFFNYDKYRHEYNYIFAADMDGDLAPDPILHYAARDLNVDYFDDEYNNITWFKNTFTIVPSIQVASFDATCNSNQTLDETDDYIDFNLNINGILTSEQYQILFPEGSILPETGTYNQTQQFSIVTDDPNVDSLYLTIIDSENNTLMLEIAIENPGSCSDYPSFIDINIDNINCLPGELLNNPEDDRISFDLEINSSSLTATYTLTGAQFTTTTGNYNELQTFTAEPGTAGNGDLVLMLNDTNHPNQTIEISIGDPGDCSTVSLSDLSNTIQVLTTPNPFNDLITFEFHNVSNIQGFTLRITSITGQEINDYPLSSDKLTIDQSQLNSGLYLYQLVDQKTNEIKTSGLIVKQ